jgi:hypothetical protein
MELTLSPFQGCGRFGPYSQGVALACIITAFQADHSEAAGILHSDFPRAAGGVYYSRPNRCTVHAHIRSPA